MQKFMCLTTHVHTSTTSTTFYSVFIFCLLFTGEFDGHMYLSTMQVGVLKICNFVHTAVHLAGLRAYVYIARLVFFLLYEHWGQATRTGMC